jgi:hypothetical protein
MGASFSRAGKTRRDADAETAVDASSSIIVFDRHVGSKRPIMRPAPGQGKMNWLQNRGDLLISLASENGYDTNLH